jgi:2-dehydropantoate 2-reductase
MRYLVYGAGAVGGYLGASLALAGFAVTFYDRPEVAESLTHSGLSLEHAGRVRHLPGPVATSDLKRLQPAPQVVLLAVKAYDCDAAAQSIRESLPGDVPVVCMLNGIGNEATLAAAIGPGRVIPASLTSAVRRLEGGGLRLEKARGVGLHAGHPLSAAIAADLAAAGLRPRLYRHADGLKWSKLLTNLVANATSAILDTSADEVFRHRGLYRLEVEALRETVRVMRALGLRPVNLPGVPAGLLAAAVFLPDGLTHPILRRAAASGRGEKRPSFAYDIGRGRSEIGWLNGAVVAQAARLGIAAPANGVLTELLTGLVKGRRDPASLRRHPERLLAEAERAGVPGLRGYNPDAPSPSGTQA